MSVIHMEPEEVREAARRVDLAVGELYFKPGQLKSAANAIMSAWEGGKAARYAAQLRQMAGVMQSAVIELQRLAQRARGEVDEWEYADQSGASRWRTITTLPAALTAAGSATLFVSQGEKFDWFKWGKGSRSFESVHELLTRIPYDSEVGLSYKGIGRTLNALVGNEKAGFVGFMDDVGHIIKSPLVKEGLPLGLGIVGDWRDGDSLGMAAVSEVAEFLIDKGLYAIPVVGQAYLFYQGALSIGHLISGGMELFGMHDQAVTLQNTLETLDFTDRLGDAFTDRLGDAIANFTLNPPDISLEVEVEIQVKARFGFEMSF